MSVVGVGIPDRLRAILPAGAAEISLYFREAKERVVARSDGAHVSDLEASRRFYAAVLGALEAVALLAGVQDLYELGVTELLDVTGEEPEFKRSDIDFGSVGIFFSAAPSPRATLR